MSLIKKERNTEILYLHNHWFICEAIGGLFGISKQRVNQIVWEDKVRAAKERGFGEVIKVMRITGHSNKVIAKRIERDEYVEKWKETI